MSSLTLNLKLASVIDKINQNQAKTVLVQLPDGLKSKIPELKRELEKKTSAQIYFWLNSCYGACDTPRVSNIDLIVQFGHSRWK